MPTPLRKKIVKKKIEDVTKIISGIVPNLLNIQIKIEGAEFDPRTKKVVVNEIIIDFNLGNKK